MGDLESASLRDHLHLGPTGGALLCDLSALFMSRVKDYVSDERLREW